MTNTAQEKVNILLVDDKRANLVALEAMLASDDYNLVATTSGEEALKFVLKQDFAVILLDVMMPGMDGFEFAKLVRQRGRAQSTPIIFLTAIAKDFRFQHQGYVVGAVDYMHKPLDTDIVRAKVAVFVELFRKNQRIQAQERLLREAAKREQEYKLAQFRADSDRHYRELAEAIPQIVFTADPKGSITFLSRKWTDLTGAPVEDMKVWDDFGQYLHPDDAFFAQPRWLDVLKAEAAIETEDRILDKNGRYRWHLARAVPERDASGKLVTWLGTLTDIHRQKNEEIGNAVLADLSAALSCSLIFKECLLGALQACVPRFCDAVAIDLIDSEQRVERHLYVEESWAAPALMQALEPESNQLEDVFARGALALKENSEAIAVPKREAVGALAGLEAGGIGPRSLISAPLMSRGTRIGAVTAFYRLERAFEEVDTRIVMDIVRHTVHAFENARAHAEIQRANTAKDEFLAVLSHELRTPLNAMIGWTQFLRLNMLDEATRHGLEVIERNGKSLAQMVSDLLDMSRIITGKISIETTALDAQAFLTATLDAVRPAAEQKKIMIHSVLCSEGVVVLADEDRLQQVFWNILTNAIKFTPEGGQIDVFAHTREDSLVVVIKDTGVGIHADFMPRIFDRFSQADSSTTRRHAGLGLGLALVKHMVEMHGGQISAHSDGPGKGACFAVSLPLIGAKEPALLRPASHPLSEGAVATDLTGISVFVVDDDVTARDIVVAFLKRGGASVRSAGSVSEAMVGIRQFKPDVVISDIGMPEQDGFDLLRGVRELEPELGKTIRLAALTAYASSEHAIKILDAGFDAHFSKPFKVDELLAAVAKLSGHRPTNRQSKALLH